MSGFTASIWTLDPDLSVVLLPQSIAPQCRRGRCTALTRITRASYITSNYLSAVLSPVTRELYPSLLRKGDRGKFHDITNVPGQYGEQVRYGAVRVTILRTGLFELPGLIFESVKSIIHRSNERVGHADCLYYTANFLNPVTNILRTPCFLLC